ncbi:MAG: rRNA pseudouridine synthase [Cyanobacteria bacterium REEB67]|nr:rRNA pseudouridine synthase [Cyanobacteria bacterium REEB67]
MELFRLNRALALCGLASRRKADDYIRDGLVRVNGQTVTDFSHMVDLNKDRLEVDGEPLARHKLDYVILHKPRRVVVTTDDERGRTCVLDLLPEALRHLKPVGRLDADSEGLLLLTNDGALAKLLTHPSHQVPKLYVVTVEGRISDQHLRTMADGVQLSEGKTKPCWVRKISANAHTSVFELELQEGRNRQIRRMCAKVGYSVIRLVRVAIGGLQLRELASGHWRRLSNEEVAELKRLLD